MLCFREHRAFYQSQALFGLKNMQKIAYVIFREKKIDNFDNAIWAQIIAVENDYCTNLGSIPKIGIYEIADISNPDIRSYINQQLEPRYLNCIHMLDNLSLIYINNFKRLLIYRGPL